MVMALGKLREARVRGQEQEIERMIQSMRNIGISEADIQKAVDDLNARSNDNKRS